ncbi:MAG TPA: hypothetical protein PKJ62_02350 [Bacteroidia bacterium]|nr:hypothetical protein [Bacteroidia bacterium]
MDQLSEVLMYFVPAMLVMVAMFVVLKRFVEAQKEEVKNFLERDLKLKLADDKSKRWKESQPLRLQACERLILFLERISPNSILLRVNRTGMNATQLHSDLLATIRAEYEHNLSQQLYISEEAWEEVKSAKEAMVKLCHLAYNLAGNNATGLQLSSQIFEQALKLDSLPTQTAIDFIKAEAREMFE